MRSFCLCLVSTILFLVPSTAVAEQTLNVLFLGDHGHHQPAKRAAELIPVLKQRGIDIRYTDNVDDLNAKTLAKFDALIVYANIGKITPEQEKALLDYVAGGKGFVPLHCASYCFLNSPKYVALVGAQFKRHKTGVFRTEIAKADHPIIKGFDGFESWDETYVHHRHNDKDRTVLEYRAEGNGKEPWTWVRTHGKGRVFYTAWGHDERTWSNPGFHNLVERGIRWAVGQNPAAAGEFVDVPTYVARAKKQLADRKLKPFEYKDAKIAFYPPGGTPADKRTWNKMQLPVSPDESQKHMVLPPGFEAKMFAAEPQIKKPLCMNWDDRGRLWIAESVDYPNNLRPAGEGRDQIRICEDTDNDGHADKFTVFADKLSIPTALLFYNGGVIVHQAPHTLFLKDTDGDDKADVRKILFSGWGTFDTHAGPSNLRYGLDNQIWGAVGYSGFKGTVGGKQLRFPMGFYRFRPDGSKLEYLCTTTNNTWGLGFSEDGLVFGSTANNCPSVYLAIPNRYYESVPGMSAGRINSIAKTHVFHPVTDKVRQVDAHGRYTAAAGHSIYTARAYPPQYWNQVAFVNGPTGHLTGQYQLERQGSDVVALDMPPLLASDDEWTAPTMAEVGPDGNVWIIDWYNYIVQHNPTPRGFKTGRRGAYETPLRDKTHGRIYRIVHKDSPKYTPIRLDNAKPAELVAALAGDNMLWRKHAQRLLVQRGKRDVVPELVALVEDDSVDAVGLNVGAIHALWTLHGLGALDGKNAVVVRAATQALAHSSAAVRRNALMVLPPTPESTAAILSAGLLEDKDAQVRLAAFLALAEMPRSNAAGAAVYTAIQMPHNKNDRWLPTAATIAAVRHDAGFLKAVLAASGGKMPEKPAVPAPLKPVNLIANPSFEKTSGDQPVGWTVRNYSGRANHKLALGGHTGKYCVEINSADGADTSWFTTVRLKPNTTYKLSAWIKTKDVGNVRGGNGALLNVHELQQPRVATAALKATHDWAPASVTFNSKQGGTITINCLFGGWGFSKGTAWYDDLELIEIGPGDAPSVAGLDPAVDKALKLVAKSYASRGAVESIVAILSTLKNADPRLTASILDGLVAGWPKDVKPTVSGADKVELAALMKSLPQDHRDRLVALADRWGQRDIFSGDIAAALNGLAKRVGDPKISPAERVDAAERLVRLADNAETIDGILAQIDPQQSPALVQGLVEAVAASRIDATGAKLAARFAQITPASRRMAISVLLRRPAWTTALLDALEKNTIGVGDVSDQAWQILTLHRDAKIAGRAKTLAGKSRLPNADRQKVYESLLHVTKKVGDAVHGRKVFEMKCAQCHRLGDLGKKIGPELTGIGLRPKHEILAEIIDPNRSVEANYRQWTAVTDAGLTFSGLLIAESQTTVEILDAEGKRHVLERSSLEELIPSKVSIMPVGLEKDLKPDDFAALLEFLSRSKAPHQ